MTRRLKANGGLDGDFYPVLTVVRRETNTLNKNQNIGEPLQQLLTNQNREPLQQLPTRTTTTSSHRPERKRERT